MSKCANVECPVYFISAYKGGSYCSKCGADQQALAQVPTFEASQTVPEFDDMPIGVPFLMREEDNEWEIIKLDDTNFVYRYLNYSVGMYTFSFMKPRKTNVVVDWFEDEPQVEEEKPAGIKSGEALRVEGIAAWLPDAVAATQVATISAGNCTCHSHSLLSGHEAGCSYIAGRNK